MSAIVVIALVGFVQSASGRACCAYCHSEFYKYFEGLGTAEARVNPMERLLFSVLLTTTDPRPEDAHLRQASTKQISRLF